MPKSIKDLIKDFLVNNVINQEQLDIALKAQKEKGGNLSHILVEQKFITEKKLMVELGKHLNLPPIDLNKVKVPPETIELIPKNLATFYQAIPISKIGRLLTIAMADPLNILAIDDLKLVTGFDIQPVISNINDIKITISYV